MTRAEALRVLIYASRFAAGAGTGVRETSTHRERAAIVRAIHVLYREAYEHRCSDNVLRNLGLLS